MRQPSKEMKVIKKEPNENSRIETCKIWKNNIWMGLTLQKKNQWTGCVKELI